MASADDDFNRGSMGSNWTDIINSWGIISNQAAAQVSNDYNVSRFTGVSFGNDQIVSIQVGTELNGGSESGIMVRCDGSGNGYLANLDPSNWGLFGAAPLASGSVTWSIGDTLLISAIGSTITMRRNGGVLASVTDTDFTTGTPALWSYNVNIWLDNFHAEDSAPVTFGGAAMQHLRNMGVI